MDLYKVPYLSKFTEQVSMKINSSLWILPFINYKILEELKFESKMPYKMFEFLKI